MLDFDSGTKVYLACGTTDLRKGFEGLKLIINLNFQLDPYSKSMFVFCNRNRTAIKILQWDGSGLWLYTKRLDRGTFRWPSNPDEVKMVGVKQLQWILQGLSAEQKYAFPDRHPTLIV